MASQSAGSGYVGDLSQSQQEALKLFRSKLPTSEVSAETKITDSKTYVAVRSASVQDSDCLRFLRANKFNVDSAVTAFTKCLEWRFSLDVENVVKDVHKRKTDMLSIIVPHAYHGFDREGRPLYFEKTGKVHVDALLTSFSDPQLLREHINFMETQAGRCAEGSKIAGKPIETWSTVMDLKGLHSGHRKALKLYKIYANCDTPNYPERMGFIMIINAPWIFPTLFNIVKRWLDPATTKKIFVVGGNPNEEMLKHIPAEHLPSEYGGTCKTCANAPNCVPERDIALLRNFHRSSTVAMPSAATDGDATSEAIVIKVGARKSFSLDVNVEGGSTVSWYFNIDAHDIQFSVEFLSGGGGKSDSKTNEKKPASTPRTWIYSPTRVSASSGVAVQGSHSLKETESGVIRLVWDNGYSYFTSKTVRYELVLSDNKTEDVQASEIATSKVTDSTATTTANATTAIGTATTATATTPTTSTSTT